VENALKQNVKKEQVRQACTFANFLVNSLYLPGLKLIFSKTGASLCMIVLNTLTQGSTGHASLFFSSLFV
jgi:hypothetical protein